MRHMISAKPKRPWYHLTPDRFFVGLLAVQVFLLLSEHFQWFAFNEKKGWTVLIAVGVVGLAVFLMLIWGLAFLLLRQRFQFSFRSLLVFVLALSVPLAWLAMELQKARRQRAAVERILETGGDVMYDYEHHEYQSDTFAPAIMRKLLGNDFLGDVISAQLYDKRAG